MSANSQQEQQSYIGMKNRTLDYPATPLWVRELILRFDEQDPVDVLHGLAILTELFRMKAREGARS